MSLVTKVIIGIVIAGIAIAAVVVVVDPSGAESSDVGQQTSDAEKKMLDEATSIDKFKTDPAEANKEFKPYID